MASVEKNGLIHNGKPDGWNAVDDPVTVHKGPRALGYDSDRDMNRVGSCA